MFSRLLNRMRAAFKQRSVRWGTAIVLVVMIILIIGLIRGGGDEVSDEVQLPTVTTAAFEDLLNGTTVEQTAVIEPARSAPLVARAGGRVTALYAHVGDTVGAGNIIVEIDGSTRDNPARANTAGLRASLAVLDRIEAAGTAAADVSVSLAQEAAEAADTAKGLNIEAATKARQQADIAVEQARLSLQDARDIGSDSLVRAADIAFKQARAAQDQATVALQQTRETSSQSLTQSGLGLENAELARTQAVEQFASQRQSLVTQLSAAAATVGQQQVTSPFNGEVTRLAVRVGDLLIPGQIIGEVNALEGAAVRLHVSAGVAAQVQPGDALVLTDTRQTFTGTVAHKGSAPDSRTSLWQLDIGITETPTTIYPGQSVAVQIPATSSISGAKLLPLSTVVVREDSLVLFSIEQTISEGTRVREHVITPLGFEGDTVVTDISLPSGAEIITDGHRLLQNGDEVAIVS